MDKVTQLKTSLLKAGKLLTYFFTFLPFYLFTFISFLPFYLFTSCTQDAYDQGEGPYSLMRADFVEANSNSQKQIYQITTDDGDILQASEPFTPKFVTTPDSLYRCILYYNKERERFFSPISIGSVPCPAIIPASQLESEMKTDPVKFESAWMSRSGKYINLSLYLMNGSSDDDAASHILHIVQDTIMTNPDASRTCYLRLYHDQGGIPEYYSSQLYTSIRTPLIDADSVCLSIATYQGIIQKSFSLNPRD